MDLSIINHGTFLVFKDKDTENVYLVITSDPTGQHSWYKHSPKGWDLVENEEAERIQGVALAVALSSYMEQANGTS